MVAMMRKRMMRKRRMTNMATTVMEATQTVGLFVLQKSTQRNVIFEIKNKLF